MSISIRWGCGHTTALDLAKGQRPTACTLCGHTQRTRVIADPPRFTGTVRGPLAEFKALEPIARPLEGN